MDDKAIASMRFATITDASSKLREDGFEGGLAEQIKKVREELARLRHEENLGPFWPAAALQLATARAPGASDLATIMRQAIAAARLLYAQEKEGEVGRASAPRFDYEVER